MKKAYIAASSREPDISDAERLIQHLKGLGYDVYDWPRQVREKSGLSVSTYELQEAAREEYQWISQCDLFVLLAPEVHSGALVEFGFALALLHRARILVIRPERATIFGHLVKWTTPTVESAMRELTERVFPARKARRRGP